MLLIAGFALSELLLFGQGTLIWARWGMLPGYHWMLFGVSAMLPLGAGLLLTGALTGSAHGMASRSREGDAPATA